MPLEQTKVWRSNLKEQRAQLEQDFLKNKNPASLLKKHTKLVDELLNVVWEHSALNNEVTLIAVGGYGREELFPYSDIDLLILLPDNVSDEQNKEIETLIGVLWDLGLNIGHSVRSLQECIDEAANDSTIQTNLLESRLLCGSQVIYTRFFIEIKQQLDPTNFLASKVSEQNNRHAKFNDTAYNLEPNIKESPGGLRDIQTILWLSQSQGLGNNWLELAKNGVISQEELTEIKRHERNLHTLRIRLHYLAKRSEDRLLFDFQNELAANLGLVDTEGKRASEQLMQSYYRSARFITLINEILLKSFALTSPSSESRVVINERFVSSHQLLETSSPDLFQDKPSTILECFLLLQQHPELEGFSPLLLRQLQDATKLITKEFRESPDNQQLFLTILKQEYGVHQSLRRMNRYGVLGKYIPPFGKIIGQMQHDLFHVYTVDEHTLKLLGNLRRFSKPQLEHEFPLCSQLFTEFEKPYLLYLAAIFHDIAKGRGGDHSALGKKDAKRFCNAHQLPVEDTELVIWLVEKHLQLSKVAQKSDLSDPVVIEQFAKLMGSKMRLTALYLLTVADVRATSPSVWNAWKAKLLESLFLETQRILNDPTFTVKNAIAARQEKAKAKLSKYGLEPEAYAEFWGNAGEGYFSKYNSNEIAWHTRRLITHIFTEKSIVRARLSREGNGIEVMIYTRSYQDLFARICNFFDRIGYSIGEAKIFTTNHDYALNNFIVLDESTTGISYNGLLKHIEESLGDKIIKRADVEPPIKGRVERQVKHMPITTKVMFDSLPEGSHQMLDIIACDQPGLLANIAFILIEHNVKVHNAKINTLGNRAEDTFLISGHDGLALSSDKMQELKEALLQL
ncbi:MAG: [protein-PII] uridylyltransferase [Methylophilaceae bacterium]|jgi:[protein-PII] uridylyltransferase|nr:[protein-PII] uridylyltransferase [Methylophilaceae bacterium]